MRLVYIIIKKPSMLHEFFFLVFIRAERFTTQGICKKEDDKSLFQSCSR